jgi:hypothetical protein
MRTEESISNSFYASSLSHSVDTCLQLISDPSQSDESQTPKEFFIRKLKTFIKRINEKKKDDRERIITFESASLHNSEFRKIHHDKREVSRNSERVQRRRGQLLGEYP